MRRFNSRDRIMIQAKIDRRHVRLATAHICPATSSPSSIGIMVQYKCLMCSYISFEDIVSGSRLSYCTDLISDCVSETVFPAPPLCFDQVFHEVNIL